ncbi:MAG: hypothetical protein HFI05_02065 [Lachnospiraceae bacterium]|jgi:hypothetical protein|nr:hypothetical protein [Lachnospiraceae bacterium]
MIFRGFTNSNERVDFRIQDCPVFVSTNMIALFGVKGSRLIKADTVTRGDEQTNIFEGDKVYSEKEFIGIVIYAKGFMLQDLDNVLKILPSGNHIKIEDGDSSSAKIAFHSEYRTELLFQYYGVNVNLKSFVAKLKNGLAVIPLKSLIDANELLLYTGIIKEDGSKLFFGQNYKGGTIVLHNNIPMIKTKDDEFILID